MKQTVNIFWFRRDLRLYDNVGLFESLQGKHQVLPIFIFDSDILEQLPEDDARPGHANRTGALEAIAVRALGLR